MKFITKTNNIVHKGNVKSNEVKIRKEDSNILVTLLSSQLYKDPVNATIRELVSNAVDSHKKAKTDEKIIISFDRDADNKKLFQIRDFGTGLSPKEFDLAYKNLGYSDKRDSNKYLGSFGIGKFAPLSYADNVIITAIKDGIMTKYNMYKDNYAIKIDELYQGETKEKNGLHIFFYLKKEDNYFTYDVMKMIQYMQNITVLVEGKECFMRNNSLNAEQKNEICEEFKNVRLNTFTHNKFYNRYQKHNIRVCIGDLIYELPKNIKKNYLNNFDLRFNIGDIILTPNREEILETEENKKKIEEKISLAIQELEKYLIKNDKTTLLQRIIRAHQQEASNIKDKFYFTLNAEHVYITPEVTFSAYSEHIQSIDHRIWLRLLSFDAQRNKVKTKKVSLELLLQYLRQYQEDVILKRRIKYSFQQKSDFHKFIKEDTFFISLITEKDNTNRDFAITLLQKAIDELGTIDIPIRKLSEEEKEKEKVPGFIRCYDNNNEPVNVRRENILQNKMVYADYKNTFNNPFFPFDVNEDNIQFYFVTKENRKYFKEQNKIYVEDIIKNKEERSLIIEDGVTLYMIYDILPKFIHYDLPRTLLPKKLNNDFEKIEKEMKTKLLKGFSGIKTHKKDKTYLIESRREEYIKKGYYDKNLIKKAEKLAKELLPYNFLDTINNFYCEPTFTAIKKAMNFKK